METEASLPDPSPTGTVPAGSGQTVAVTGATGFIGAALLPVLAKGSRVVALTRRVPDASSTAIEWRRCDLFSLRDAENALRGVDVAIYLVHSMQPTARLTQGSFADLDLLLADNFGRAAATAGVRRIVYLGGLIPDDEEALSAHLASRQEVEAALGAHGVEVTTLRAGLIVGGGGSSLRILARLVARLPVMVTPGWTRMPCQPIAVDDVIQLIDACVRDPATAGETYDIGGPEVLTYLEMMRETAQVLRKRRWMVPVPFFTPTLSRLWVTLVTETPRQLVAPLVQSLRHPMVARDRRLQERVGIDGESFRPALERALRSEGFLREPTVRAVHRLVRPPGRDATWVAEAYARWLPGFLGSMVRVHAEAGRLDFSLAGVQRPLLELTHRPERSDESRALYEITGGLLFRQTSTAALPRLEFRFAPGSREGLAAVHDFVPRLPWWIYVATQSPLHDFVMRAFGRHLAREAGASEGD